MLPAVLLKLPACLAQPPLPTLGARDDPLLVELKLWLGRGSGSRDLLGRLLTAGAIDGAG